MSSFPDSSFNTSNYQNEEMTENILKAEVKFQELLQKSSAPPFLKAANICSTDYENNITEFMTIADQLKQTIRGR